jgi:hypothetical protein
VHLDPTDGHVHPGRAVVAAGRGGAGRTRGAYRRADRAIVPQRLDEVVEGAGDLGA